MPVCQIEFWCHLNLFLWILTTQVRDGGQVSQRYGDALRIPFWCLTSSFLNRSSLSPKLGPGMLLKHPPKPFTLCQGYHEYWRKEWQPTPVSFAWRIPWTEEPSGLQSMGLKRVGHDWFSLSWLLLKIQAFHIFHRKKWETFLRSTFPLRISHSADFKASWKSWHAVS